MKLILLSLLIFLGNGCVKYASFHSDDQETYIKTSSMKMKNIEIIPWKVGSNYQATISKGFVVVVPVPRLKEQAIDALFKRGVDSWLARVMRGNGSRREYLGHISVPFVAGSKTPRKVFINNFAFQVVYAANAISVKHDQAKCPLFNHKKSLITAKFVNTNSSDKTFNVNLVGISVNFKVHKRELFPALLNGRMSLAGDYYIELALYGQQEKKRFSDFFSFEHFINVDEQEVTIPGC